MFYLENNLELEVKHIPHNIVTLLHIRFLFENLVLNKQMWLPGCNKPRL
jgi:hypothetical protein